MPDTYYQSGYTGRQIDDAIGRLISGELDNLVFDAWRASDSAQNALSGVQDAIENIPDGETLIVNDLTTGGTTMALSAEQGKNLKQSLDSHAYRHAPDGADPITPAMIGTYAAAEIDAALQRKSNPNLLDNWYFLDHINQRGQTEYSGTSGVYTVDRWRVANGVVVVDDDGITFTTRAASSSSMCHLMQYIEAKKIMQGREYAVSALTKSGELLTATSAFPASGTKLVSVNDTWGFNFALSSNGSYYVSLRAKDNTVSSTIGLVAIKLELGSVQTLAHQDENGTWVLNDPPLDKGTELLKCQRYYQLFSSADTRPANLVDYRPTMRVTPKTGTITIGEVTYYYADANI